MDQIKELLNWILHYKFIYLASRYGMLFTKDTPAQDFLLQNRYSYIIHSTQNHTQWTYRVHTTLKENQFHTRLVSFIYNCIFNKSSVTFQKNDSLGARKEKLAREYGYVSCMTKQLVRNKL